MLQQRVCTFGLAFGGEKAGKTACRAQGKSSLAALAGERQRLLEVPFSECRIIDLRVRGKPSFDTKALDLVPVVTTPPEDVARLLETAPSFRQLIGADKCLSKPAKVGRQPVDKVRRLQEIALLLQRVDALRQAAGFDLGLAEK